MDALNIADGSRVADVGAGAGWFTVRLARRVGPNGRVYAEVVYAEVADPVLLLTHIAAALKPQGRLGIVDWTKEGGGPGTPMERRIEAADVIRDAEAAGLTLLSHETFLTYQFLLVFGLDQHAAPSTLKPR